MDYCDRCGAIGKTKFFLPGDLDLVFCGHHSREYEAKLNDLKVVTLDLDDILVPA